MYKQDFKEQIKIQKDIFYFIYGKYLEVLKRNFELKKVKNQLKKKLQKHICFYDLDERHQIQIKFFLEFLDKHKISYRLLENQTEEKQKQLKLHIEKKNPGLKLTKRNILQFQSTIVLYKDKQQVTKIKSKKLQKYVCSPLLKQDVNCSLNHIKRYKKFKHLLDVKYCSTQKQSSKGKTSERQTSLSQNQPLLNDEIPRNKILIPKKLMNHKDYFKMSFKFKTKKSIRKDKLAKNNKFEHLSFKNNKENYQIEDALKTKEIIKQEKGHNKHLSIDVKAINLEHNEEQKADIL